MGNPLYGQNKADNKVSDGSYLIVGDTFSIAAADTAVASLYGGVSIPAGSYVEKVGLEVLVVAAGGTAATTQFDVGSIADPDMFLDDVDGADTLTGMGGLRIILIGQTGANLQPVYFAANDMISAKCIAESSTSGSVRLLVWLSTPA